MPWLDAAGTCAEPEGVGELNGCLEGACALAEEETAFWKPLVLLIPLRLGLSDINEAYIETLKVRCANLPLYVTWGLCRTGSILQSCQSCLHERPQEQASQSSAMFLAGLLLVFFHCGCLWN